jgi:hypothetical protein
MVIGKEYKHLLKQSAGYKPHNVEGLCYLNYKAYTIKEAKLIA